MIDIRINAAGDMDVAGFDIRYATAGEQVAQRLRIKLRTFLGEVPLNLDAGVPWFEEILGVKPLNLNNVESILREQILSTPEVESIDSFRVDYNEQTRGFKMDFTAISVYGPLSLSVESPEVS
jgi:hypothetical protein